MLVLGDNLGDFTDKYKGTIEERHAFFDQSKEHWGHDWIMLPNPEYGSWESAAFGHDYKIPAHQRRQMKIDALQPWEVKK
jgi:acid phosphatase